MRDGKLITLQNLSVGTVTTDFKAELRRLNRELLFTFLDLLDCLVQRPSAYARAVENVGLIARNMSYLLNALRSEQASLLSVSGMQEAACTLNCLCLCAHIYVVATTSHA